LTLAIGTASDRDARGDLHECLGMSDRMGGHNEKSMVRTDAEKGSRYAPQDSP